MASDATETQTVKGQLDFASDRGNGVTLLSLTLCSVALCPWCAPKCSVKVHATDQVVDDALPPSAAVQAVQVTQAPEQRERRDKEVREARIPLAESVSCH